MLWEQWRRRAAAAPWDSEEFLSSPTALLAGHYETYIIRSQKLRELKEKRQYNSNEAVAV